MLAPVSPGGEIEVTIILRTGGDAGLELASVFAKEDIALHVRPPAHCTAG